MSAIISNINSYRLKMKLLNSFYTIKSRDITDSSIRYEIQLDSSHYIYSAHFPDCPITPGVCIIQIGKELLEDYLGKKYIIQAVKNVKFLNLISPLEIPVVSYTFDKISSNDVDNTCKVLIQVSSGETSLAKLSFTCMQK